MPIKLQVDQLNWSISNKSTLQHLFFAKSKREVIGIISYYTTGKASLLHCITHQQKNILVTALNGNIYLKNKIVNHCNINYLTQHLSLITQKPVVSYSLTDTDIVNVDLLKHKAVFTLGMQINDFNELSNCKRQRLLIARTLVQDAKFVVNNITQYFKKNFLFIMIPIINTN